MGSAMPHIKSGRVRVLAVTTKERSFVDKSWPTMSESGVPGVSSSIWAGIFAPKGVPQPVIDKIYRDIAEALKLPDVKARFAAGGGVTVGMPPAEYAAAIRKEAAALKVVVAKAGVKPE
jgi:tripartite-type tricarboxylate transporter receptor subunit TctC